MEKPKNNEPAESSFVQELRQQKYEIGEKLSTKKTEISRLDAEQRKLKSIIDAEKHHGTAGKQKKGKQHDQDKAVRQDIAKNEQKFKDQARKIEELRKEIQHLEMDFKSLTHDLSVVEQSH